jgi:hypothetical protein
MSSFNMAFSIIFLFLQIINCSPSENNNIRWYQIPGRLKKISANNHEIWGIGMDNSLYKCPLPCDGRNNRWIRLNGTPRPFTKISLNDYEVWGKDQSGSLFRCSLPCEGPQDWIQIPGSLKSFQITDDVALGIDFRGSIYKSYLSSSSYYPQVKWHQIQGTNMKKISFNGMNIWGLDMNNNLYRFEPRVRIWIKQPRQMATISVSKYFIYGLDINSKGLWKCQLPCLESDWESLGGRWEQIEASNTDPFAIFAISNGQPYLGVQRGMQRY